MGEFYITKVTAKGSGKQDSSVYLRPGLNIIQGRSNTGKTCIIKCIDFCFGSKTKPFDDSFGSKFWFSSTTTSHNIGPSEESRRSKPSSTLFKESIRI